MASRISEKDIEAANARRALPANQAKIQALADDFSTAAPKLARIIPGDRAGEVIAFDPNPRQQLFFDTVNKVRAFHLARGLFALKSRAVEKVAWKLFFQKDRGEVSFKELTDAVFNFGAGRAFRVFHEKTGIRLLDQVRMIVGKARQVGFSTAISWIGAHRTAFLDNHNTLVTAHESTAATNIFQFARRFFDLWPEQYEYARPLLINDANQTLVTHNGGNYDVKTAGGRDIRSFKYDFLHLSEFAHYDSVAAISAIVSAVQQHCWVFKESTAKGMGGRFYTDWRAARYIDEVIEAYDKQIVLDGWSGYFKFFAPWFEDPRYIVHLESWEEDKIRNNLSDYEAALMSRYPDKITLGKLAWRRLKIQNDCNDPVLSPEAYFAQEFPADEMEMFQNSSDRPFDHQKLEVMAEKWAVDKSHPVTFKVTDNEPPKLAHVLASNFTVWDKPVSGAKYIIGADIAQGLIHRDRSIAAIFRRVDGTTRYQVAEWRGHINPVAFGHILVMLAEWYNNAYLVPEVNNQGLATCETIVHTLQYPHIYHRKVFGQLRNDTSDDGFVFGFNTANNSVKTRIIEELIYAVRDDLIDIKSIPTLNEMKTFTVVHNSTGTTSKYSAPAGMHDDGVMAVALANYCDNVLRGAPRMDGSTSTDHTRIPSASRNAHDIHEAGLIAALKKEAEQLKHGPHKAGKKAWWLG